MKSFNLLFIAFLFSLISVNAQNDSTTSEKEIPVQFTFITPLGTNGLAFSKATNRFSLNLLAGVSKGLHGTEFGSLANVILKDVKGVQFAGLSNIVLGPVKGAQFAGCLNYSGEGLKGVAMAGLGNVNPGTLDGGQFSGVFNVSHKGGRGAQVAGCVNVVTGEFKGTQIASCVNVAKDIEGAQISALVNKAKKVKGVQVGLINIADTVDGASIALFSFINKGMHQLEVSADELFYANISYRAGTKSFHNIFTAGFQPGSDKGMWQFGYGAGTSVKLKERLFTDLSATIHHINTNGFFWGTSELLRLYCGVDYKLTKTISIAAGPTFNLYLSDKLLEEFDNSNKNVAPYHLLNYTSPNDFNVKGWVGAKVALRFF